MSSFQRAVSKQDHKYIQEEFQIHIIISLKKEKKRKKNKTRAQCPLISPELGLLKNVMEYAGLPL